ncbi:MAG: hypothetical protein QME21_14810 [Anaerolineales bacterium]|nr:hypothetical protein [Anaerolineales bacterium]
MYQSPYAEIAWSNLFILVISSHQTALLLHGAMSLQGVFLAPKDENIATEFTEFTETIFPSDAAYAGIFFHSLLLSVAQILIPLVINAAQGEDPIFRQPENDFGRGLLQSLRFFARTFCKL